MVKQIAWNTGDGNIILTYQGQGDGTITVQSDKNNGSARSQVITIETTNGSPVVAKNLTISQTACPVPVGTVLNYEYTATVQSVLLPAGSYKLQCWGAQGGSTNLSTGGKGGYAEGVLTLSQPTTVYIFVGGKGTSEGETVGNGGGWNGGGGAATLATSKTITDDYIGSTVLGFGGGATDIALTTSSMSYSNYRTNRSFDSLISRMIVAGGGSGASRTYKQTFAKENLITSFHPSPYYNHSGIWYYYGNNDAQPVSAGMTIKPVLNDPTNQRLLIIQRGSNNTHYATNWYESGTTITLAKADPNVAKFCFHVVSKVYVDSSDITLSVYEIIAAVVTRKSSDGYAGGGISGGGYADKYKGRYNVYGQYGSIGRGANKQTVNTCFHGGLGGGGWYGGGTDYSDSDMLSCKYSGGGSGFVNYNAQYLPPGYTGLHLDSGSTTDGSQTFEAPAGGTETGHSGNGYARITRLN